MFFLAPEEEHERQTETVTRGFNRPLNQFAQHQDKTRMYNFLR